MDSSGKASDKALPSFRVDTRQLPRNEAFSLWQDELIPHWELQPHDKDAERFESATETYLIGDIVLGRVETPSQRMDRSRYRIARDGLSQYGLQFVVDGGIGKRSGGSEGWADNKGDLFVSDLTQTQMLEASNLSVVYFSMPRYLLAPRLNNPDHHNERVVSASTPLAGLLNAHVSTALRLAPSLNAAEAEAIMNVTLDLTAALLNGEVTEAEADAVAIAAAQNVRLHIEQHIGDPGLSADAVAAHFRMSRRKLYYLFEPFGGFAAYVRERRLHHIRGILTDPARQTRPIAEIAEAFGFTNQSGFIRAFRRTFGLSPREVRAMAALGRGNRQIGIGDNVWYDWLLRTR